VQSQIPPPLVVLHRMLLALTHQPSQQTRATFSWPILYVLTPCLLLRQQP